MELYRYSGFKTSGVVHSFSLGREIRPSVDLCYIDAHTINCLEKVITGPIESFYDFMSAETALRSLILHDSVSPLVPSLKVYNISRGAKKPFVFVKGESQPKLESLGCILSDVGFSCSNATIAHVFSFSDKEFAREYIASDTRKNIENDRKAKEGGYEIVNLFGNGTLEQVSSNEDEFFANEFYASDKEINKFLQEIPASGVQAYLSHPVLSSRFESTFDARNINAINELFWNPQDIDWKNFNLAQCFSINLPIPQIMSIVLSKAGNRSEIPSVIFDLKQQFASARKNLWELIDDLKYRTDCNPVMALKLIDHIQDESKKIFKNFTSQNKINVSYKLNLLGRIILGLGTGLIAPQQEDLMALKDKIGFSNSILACKLIEKNLKEVEWGGLLEKHFTQYEIKSLTTQTYR